MVKRHDFYDIHLPGADFVWDYLLAQGFITLFSAPPKVGKTTFMFDLLRAMQRGTPFLSHGTSPTPVYLLSEESATLLQQRRDATGLSTLPIEVSFLGPELWDRYLTEVQRAADAGMGLLVIDTIMRFWRIQDTFRPEEWLARLDPVRVLADRYKFAVLLVHHARSIEVGRGLWHDPATMAAYSKHLSGAADIIAILGRVADEYRSPVRLFRAESRFASSLEDIYTAWTPETGYITLDEAILRYAGDRQPTWEELAEHFQISSAFLRRHTAYHPPHGRRPKDLGDED